MNIHFSGFENSITVREDKPTSLRILNKRLFGRICQSLITNMGEFAIEPYTLWCDDGSQLSANNRFMVIVDPFSLPWSTSVLANKLLDKMDALLRENDEIQYNIEQFKEGINSSIATSGLQLHSDYCFGVDWDLRQYLKSFNYKVEHNTTDPLFDNVIKFVSYAADMAYSDVIVFVNLQIFLTENELNDLQKHVIFLKMKVLFIDAIEGKCDSSTTRKYTIDQHLLEC